MKREYLQNVTNKMLFQWIETSPIIENIKVITYGEYYKILSISMSRIYQEIILYENELDKQMKIMMYVMPVIFLGVMNSQSSGLCYYYTLGNLLTFGQQYAFKFLVDEKAIRAKIEENKKKPVTKYNFQKRLEDMAKQRGYNLPK